MSGQPGSATREVIRALATQRHERAVHLIDLEAVRLALLGVPTVLRELEAGAVVALCDLGGLDRELTARGLGVSRSCVDDRIAKRRALPGLAADLLALTMTGPAADLVAAVAARDVDAVRGVLAGLDRQHLAALAIVLADLVAPDAFGDDERDTCAA